MEVTAMLLTCWVALSAPDSVGGEDDSATNPFCDPSQPNYCENHVACHSDKTRLCGFPTRVSDRVQKVIEDTHNKCRNTVTSKGEETSSRPGEKLPALTKLPSSADMSLMNWDVELSQVANHWVASCSVEDQAQNKSSENQTRDDRGKKSGGASDSGGNVTFCFDVPRFKVKGWIWIKRGTIYTPLLNVWKDHLWDICSNISSTLTENVIESYRPPSGNDSYHEDGVSLLWAHASRLGCAQRRERGLAPERSFIALACLYAPAPLTPGIPVYRRGPPASACAVPGAGGDSRMKQLCTSGRSVDDILPTVVVVFCAIVLAFVVFCAAEKTV